MTIYLTQFYWTGTDGVDHVVKADHPAGKFELKFIWASLSDGKSSFLCLNFFWFQNK